MNTKTMEGIAGAGTNMKLANTPLRVYKEARRQNDTAAMERSMGYVGDFSDKADEYKAEAREGMKEDAEAAREKLQAECEKAVQKRREEQAELEKRMEKDKNQNSDRVEISEGGRALLKEDAAQGEASTQEKISSARTEPVIYTRTGEADGIVNAQDVNISVSV